MLVPFAGCGGSSPPSDTKSRPLHRSGGARARFAAGLGLGAQFWCIQRFAGPPIVFVHTDRQAQALRASTAPAAWADTYFEIAKQHDEFGYLQRSSIAINVDSKENFDTHFSSNWYHYFK